MDIWAKSVYFSEKMEQMVMNDLTLWCADLSSVNLFLTFPVPSSMKYIGGSLTISDFHLLHLFSKSPQSFPKWIFWFRSKNDRANRIFDEKLQKVELFPKSGYFWYVLGLPLIYNHCYITRSKNDVTNMKSPLSVLVWTRHCIVLYSAPN